MHIINSVSEYYLHQKDWKMDQVKLESMQYQELQTLAKKVGIRANLPKAELVVALLEKDENSWVESLVPLEESKLDTTFEIVNDSKQNVLNETFEKVIFEIIMCANIIVCANITIPIIPNF